MYYVQSHILTRILSSAFLILAPRETKKMKREGIRGIFQ